MTTSVFKIAGGDGACYGPRFGPVLTEAVGEVPSAEGGHILLRLTEPLQIEETTIEFLAVRPRYVGVTLADISTHGGTVGIWRVLPGKRIAFGVGINADNSEYWSIGTCTNVRAQPGAPEGRSAGKPAPRP